jgi:rhodanese-related sulfurtransferase
MEDALTDTDLPRDKLQEGLFYVSPEELARRLRSDRAPLVLDVRDPNELERELGQLPGALNIPLGQLQQRIGELSTHKRRDIVAVCRTGRRSEAAARILQDSGFERVFVLKGGMTAWRDAHR